MTRVLIIGGYGVFGGNLAKALLRDQQFEVVIAGRNLSKAKAFCAEINGGTPAYLDRSHPNFSDQLCALKPSITVDAAGPFQAYQKDPYVVPKTALKADSHYLDLSDDAAFTAGIRSLNEDACNATRVLLSGVSSVPALSSAAVEFLSQDIPDIYLIESVILPGNRAPRGLSVMKAILSQVGKPLSMFQNGKQIFKPGWSGLKRIQLTSKDKRGLPARWASFIGAPDLSLFPTHYSARTVLFRAGLELPIMHLGLWLLSCFVRLRLVNSLEPWAKPLQVIASALEPFGTDRGGMEVQVAGLNKEGQPTTGRWTLLTGAGDGPNIPAVAAAILCKRIRNHEVEAGARPCLGEVSLSEISDHTSHLDVDTFLTKDATPTLFQQALGPDFEKLEKPIQALHTVFDKTVWEGDAKVTRGSTLFSKLIGGFMGFPRASENTAVSVTIEKIKDQEIWHRRFGNTRFKSVLSREPNAEIGILQERFGFLEFDIHLKQRDGKLYFPVKSGRIMKLPLPMWLLPKSNAVESCQNNTFSFDVSIKIPGVGIIVRYQGSLKPRIEI